jgi:iron complex transport system permease protein
VSAKNLSFLTFAAIALAVLIAFAFTVGQYSIGLGDAANLLKSAFGGENADANSTRLSEVKIVLEQVRLPRVIAAAVIGAALSVSGAIFQGMFTNPLVSPGILGALNGASFGAALAMLLGLNLFGVQLSAFTFSFSAVLFALLIAKIYGGGEKILTLILGGVISSALFGALVSLVKYLADPYDTLPSIVYWLMGSMSYARIEHIIFAIPIMAIAILFALSLSKRLDLITLGEDEAIALGANIGATRLIFVAIATLLAALSVMICGVVGWVGLVVPHIARFIVGANHIAVIPASALIGAIFLLVADTFSRSIFAAEVPLGILTSIVGIPAFILALRHAKKARAC